MADDWAGNGLRGMEKSLSFGLAVLEPGTLAEEVGSADNIIINNNNIIITLQYSTITGLDIVPMRPAFTQWRLNFHTWSPTWPPR